ncbi:SSU ribosomal protein S7P [Chthonomonas calidirosea]|uniref:Small ribosomal subunit protein uS7 n=1 Tax=Chthonomonas calidirosea (strain DSM 23976 / ICMP 18418 / T49) TaxID=1303518 RepID=S0F077_CHTCT|nr:30S ribosomal protein S7 [Chthonomonas calidirosea]CCW36643.1 SSU ribosomal protein S7P [Chthonomonas calidirosea T49]CEK15616.1 SSU ribosomal protein S7P [Chthonomonas calidirosea]CEK15617.1 SSU ribosomal protein S7P [Chthonomonas calidirosea]CEK16719.1 SSU ribosomal protein S7P [Chthonomonas calidirosea]
MPRNAPEGGVRPRVIPPDPIYNSVMVQKFINRLMKDGKKSVAETIFYKAMEQIERRTQRPALEVFDQAIRNVAPVVEVRPRRVGGQTYQVPVPVREARRFSLAIRWIVLNARKRSGRNMIDKLAAELIDAANNTGASVRRREEVHRMADANKAFAHYRI